jgi:hypothetical protein
MNSTTIDITKEQWEAMNSAEKDQFWYKQKAGQNRKEFRRMMYELFNPPVIVPQSEQAKYLQSVYTFRDGKVLHCGIYEPIDERLIHNFFSALKWKYPNITKDEVQNILKTIK